MVKLRPRLGLATAALVVDAQVLLGALVRHLHAGRACSDDIPWCNGEPWPSWGPDQLHMLHRWSAVAVTLIVIAASAAAIAAARRRARRLALSLAIAAPVLVVLQVLLGVLTVTSNIGVVEVAAHLGVGALLLVDLVAAYLAFGPAARRRPQTTPVPVNAPAEALS